MRASVRSLDSGDDILGLKYFSRNGSEALEP
jgi:hypothetical protein